MQVFKEKRPLIEAIHKEKSNGNTIGLVPTMGALHDGHISLVNNALQESDQVIVSVFVNPTQFDNSEDLEKYPRNLEKDLALLEKTEGNIWVFVPNCSRTLRRECYP